MAAGTSEAPSTVRALHKTVTPLPTGQLAILSVVLVTESICSTVLIPFVGFFVAALQNWPPEKAGYSSGFLIGMYMLGQVGSSKFWGGVSDKYGRKVAITCGVSGSTLSIFFFGLSGSIWTACLWRFIHGLCGGCSLAAKTMISDVTDHTNQAKGFALVSLTWGVGTLFGPSIGGFLYDPASNPKLAWLGLSTEGFWAHHPAFLPALVVSIYNAIAVGICVCFLRETNKNMHPLEGAFPEAIRRALGPLLRAIQPKGPETLTKSRARDVLVVEFADEHEGANGAVVQRSAAHHSDPAGHATDATVPTTEAACAGDHQDTAPEVRSKRFGFKQAFQNRLTCTVCIMSMLISAEDMLYLEIFPLWSIASPDVGGLGLLSDAVAVLIIVNSVPAVLSNVVFSPFSHWVGDVLTFWRMAQALCVVTTLAVPIAPYFGYNGGYWYTMAVGIFRKASESWMFASLMLVVALSAPPGRIGVMYGVQQATACVVRAIVPFIGAPLFAWSISGRHIFPFNHFLCFIVAVVPLVVSLVVSYRVVLPAKEDHSNHQQPDLHDGDSAANSGMHGAADSHGEKDIQADCQSVAADSHYSYVLSAHNSVDGGVLGNSFTALSTAFVVHPVPELLHPAIIPPSVGGGDSDEDDVGEMSEWYAQSSEEGDSIGLHERAARARRRSCESLEFEDERMEVQDPEDEHLTPSSGCPQTTRLKLL